MHFSSSVAAAAPHGLCQCAEKIGLEAAVDLRLEAETATAFFFLLREISRRAQLIHPDSAAFSRYSQISSLEEQFPCASFFHAILSDTSCTVSCLL